MITQKNKALKRFTYICLSLTSIILSTELQARARFSEDCETDRGNYLSVSQSGKIQANNQKYNLVGVALFSGQDPVSYTIKSLTHSNISHVGMILSDVKDEKKRYCFESTGSADEVIKGIYPHVRVTPWEEVVENYNGKVSYRLFVFDKGRTSPNQVTNFVEEYDGKSFTKNPLKLFKALFKANEKSNSRSLNTAFCSELTAKMLMDLGIIEENVPSNYIPKDFSSKSSTQLTSGIELTPEFIEK